MNRVRLKDICVELSDGLHAAPIFNEYGEYLFVNATNLEDGFIVDKGEGKRADYSEYIKYKNQLDGNTILYSIDGTIGNIAKYRGEKCILGKGACYIRLNDSAQVDYIYYLLKSDLFNGYIKQMATGSTIHHISLETMRNFSFYLPTLDTQKHIAKIPAAIDEKIALNKRINAELEAMAKTLYDYWFVQFDFPDENGKPYRTSGGAMEWNEQLKREIPKGWRVGALKDIIKISGTPTSVGEHLKGMFYTPIDELPKKSMSFYGGLPYYEANSSLQLYEKNNLLLGAMRVYFHRVCISAQNGITRSTTIVLRPKNERHLPFAFEVLNMDSTIKYAAKVSVGTQQPYVNWEGTLDSHLIVLPPDDQIIDGYSEKVCSIINAVQKNVQENYELTRLRDWLLPMLMNGQATVE